MSLQTKGGKGAFGTRKAKAKSDSRKDVPVVVCPSAFPDFRQFDSHSGGHKRKRKQDHAEPTAKRPVVTDSVQDSFRDVRQYVAQAAMSGESAAATLALTKSSVVPVHKSGKPKKKEDQYAWHAARQEKWNAEDELYRKLTGGMEPPSRHSRLPPAAYRAMKRNAAEREQRAKDEARESQLLSPQTSAHHWKPRREHRKRPVERASKRNRELGPAPSVGFTKGGVLKIRKEER